MSLKGRHAKKYPKKFLVCPLQALIIFGNVIVQMWSLMYLLSQRGVKLDFGAVCLGMISCSFYYSVHVHRMNIAGILLLGR